MNTEILLWLVGATATSLLAWGIKLSWTIHSIWKKVDDISCNHKKIEAIDTKVNRILTINEDPERYGFGTKKSNQLIEENTRALKAMTHYIIWAAEKQTGERPPPPTN